jgi:hypothetical protein
MSGESRYAFNRLGLNQLVCYTCTKDKRVTHLTITKVMEKPCPLSTDVQVIENLQESILKSIAFSPCPVARTDPKRFCHIMGILAEVVAALCNFLLSGAGY